MLVRSRLLLPFAAALLLAAAVGATRANALTFNETGFRTSWSGLRFRTPPYSEFAACNVTLEGSFHALSVSSTPGSLIGYVTRATIPSCERGAVTVLTATLPWTLRYDGLASRELLFSFIHLSLQANVGTMGGTCLTHATAGSPQTDTVQLTSGTITRIQTAEFVNPPPATGLLCFAPGGDLQIEGAGRVTRLGNNEPITVRL